MNLVKIFFITIGLAIIVLVVYPRDVFATSCSFYVFSIDPDTIFPADGAEFVSNTPIFSFKPGTVTSPNCTSWGRGYTIYWYNSAGSQIGSVYFDRDCIPGTWCYPAGIWSDASGYHIPFNSITWTPPISSLANGEYSWEIIQTVYAVSGDTGFHKDDGYSTVFYVGMAAPPSAAPTWAVPNHTGNTISSINWDWNSVTGATSYKVFSGGSCGTELQTIAAPTTNWNESGLTVNANYTRTLKACNAVGCSACSTAASAYTSIQAPTGITCSAITQNSITVSGTGPISNLTADSSGIKFRETVTDPDTDSGWIQTNSWTNSGLTGGTTYAFYAQTKNGNGDQTTEIGPQNCTTLPACLVNGTACATDSTCCSGNCVLDYDGSPKICAPADQCQHNGDYNSYPAGSTYTYYPALGQYCSNCKVNTARWASNSGRFIVKKKSSGNRMILDKNGQLLLAGFVTGWLNPDGGDWLMKLTGTVKAWLDDVLGNLSLTNGSYLYEQSSSLNPTSGAELLFREKTGQTYIGRMDSSGNMYIKGQLGEQCSLP